MKQVTIIIGPKGSGKKALVNQMIKGKNVALIQLEDLDQPFVFSIVNRDTDVILFNKMSNAQLMRFIYTRPTIKINKKYQFPFEIERPEIIITSETFKPTEFAPKPYLKIITLP